MSQAKRVCLIGAGPSGMSVLYQFNQLKTQGKEIPEIVCYDKQSDWGGLWKYSWETGKEFCVLCLLIKHALKILIRTSDDCTAKDCSNEVLSVYIERCSHAVSEAAMRMHLLLVTAATCGSVPAK